MEYVLDRSMRDEGIKSLDQLARRLIEHAVDVSWPSARSLAVKLGRLNKRDGGWWLRRPEAIAALTDTLNCSREDLLLHEPAACSDRFVFEDFPELPPLRLTTEDCCWLGKFHEVGRAEDQFTDDDEFPDAVRAWLGGASGALGGSAPRPGVIWLHFPAGTGADLFWTFLKGRSPYECREVESISRVADRLKQRMPLCLRVAESNPRPDWLALSQRHRESAVVVVASFAVAGSDGANDNFRGTWRGRNPGSDLNGVSIQRDDHTMRLDDDLKNYEWRLVSGWQKTLIRWVDQRLPASGGSQFDAKQLLAWLGRVGGVRLFDSPRNLMALYRLVHHSGTRNLPSVDDRQTGRALLDMLETEDSALRSTFVELVHDWFLDLNCRWNGPVSAATWRKMTLPPQKLLESIAAEENPSERQRLLLEYENKGAVVERVGLKGSRLLRHNYAGEVSLAPAPIATLLARDFVRECLLSAGAHEWGALCFDPDRFELIQNSLSLLSVEELVACSEQVNAITNSSAALVGAQEAIFCAIGGRELSNESFPEAFKRLGARVLHRVVGPGRPLTEPWSIHPSLCRYWMNACWAWSIDVNRPDVEPDPTWSQYFPAWCDFREESDVLGEDIDCLVTALDELSAVDARCIELARRIVDRTSTDHVTAYGMFIPLLMAHSVRRHRPINPSWWEAVLEGKKPLMRMLLTDEIQRTPAVATPLLLDLVSACTKKQCSETAFLYFMVAFGLSYRGLREAIFTQIGYDELLAALNAKETAFVAQFISLLPPDFASAFISKVGSDQTRLAIWRKLDVSSMDPFPFDALVAWIDDEVDASIYARALWGVEPDRVLDVLTGQGNRTVKRVLVENFQGGREHLCRLMELLAVDPPLMSEQMDRADWALRHLPGSGALAPELMAFGGLDRAA